MTTTDIPTEARLNSGEQLVRLVQLGATMNAGPVDMLDIWAWLNGWAEYAPGTGNVPELIRSRLHADDAALIARGIEVPAT